MTCYKLAGDISDVRQIHCTLGQTGELAADMQVEHYAAGGTAYKIGHGLKLDEDNTLSVATADAVEQDNTLPVTSAAVAATVGNIEVLLGTI